MYGAITPLHYRPYISSKHKLKGQNILPQGVLARYMLIKQRLSKSTCALRCLYHATESDRTSTALGEDLIPVAPHDVQEKWKLTLLQAAEGRTQKNLCFPLLTEPYQNTHTIL